MNARTSRLLVRVAHLAWLRDPTPVDRRQPEAVHLRQLKQAWNSTPPAKREETRRGLVALGLALIEGK